MQKEDVLANCIDEVLSGRLTAEECAARHPELGEELRSLLRIAASIHPDPAAPSPDFKRRARARLLDEMQPAAPGRRLRKLWDWLRPLLPASALRAATVAVSVLLLVVVAGAGAVYGSQNSLPGDTLYPVKTSLEGLQLSVTRDQEARANLRLALAQQRMDEVVALTNLNRSVNSAMVAAAAVQMDGAIREMEGAEPEPSRAFLSRLSEATIHRQVALSQVLASAPEAAQPSLERALGVARRGGIIAQMAYQNPAFLESRPSVLDEDLEAREFEIEGVLESVDGGFWKIGGVVVQNVAFSGDVPSVGSRVKVEGVVKDQQAFVSKVENREDEDDGVKVVGKFGGTGDKETTWYVGGIAIDVSEDSQPPSRGDKVKLQTPTVGPVPGESGSGPAVLRVDDDDDDDDEEERVKVHGVLVGVDSDAGSVTLNVAGAQFSSNIDGAQIKTEDGQRLGSSDLQSLLGKTVKVSGLSKKGDRFHASRVRVDVDGRRKADKEEESDEKERDRSGEKQESDREEREGTASPTPTLQPTKPGEPDEQGEEGRDRDRPETTPTPTPTLKPGSGGATLPAPSPTPGERRQPDGEDDEDDDDDTEDAVPTPLASGPTATPPTATPMPAPPTATPAPGPGAGAPGHGDADLPEADEGNDSDTGSMGGADGEHDAAPDNDEDNDGEETSQAPDEDGQGTGTPWGDGDGDKDEGQDQDEDEDEPRTSGFGKGFWAHDYD